TTNLSATGLTATNAYINNLTVGTTTSLSFVVTTLTGTSSSFINASTTNLSVASTTYFANNTGIWNASGNVGIGTTNPVIPFQTHVGTNQNIGIQTNGGVANLTAFNDAGSAYVPLMLTGSVMSLMQGNVGIGITNPLDKLTVSGGKLNVIGGGGGTNFGELFKISRSSDQTTIVGLNVDDTTGIRQTTFDYPSTETSRFYFNNSASGVANVLVEGNVGIGITNPGQKLDVNGAMNISGTIYGGSGASQTLALKSTSGNANRSGISIGNIYNSDNGGISFFTAGASTETEAVRIQGTTGNVGIGTTNPTARLSLYGVDDALSMQTSGLTTKFIFSTGWNANVSDFFGIRNSSTATPQFMLTTAGNVGIGTTTPGFNLTVQGNSLHMATSSFLGNVGIGTTNPGATLQLNTPGTATTFKITQDNSARYLAANTYSVMTTGTELILGTADSNFLQFNTNNVEKMRITTGGNVGIGTTAPTDKLQIAGNTTPSVDATYSLGSSTLRFLNTFTQNIFASSSVITNATSTNFFTTNFSATNSTFGTVTVSTSSLGNASTTNLTVASTTYFANNTGIWNASGNVGIGTTTPGAMLDVNGNIKLSSASGIIQNVYSLQGRISDSLLHVAGNSGYAGNLFLNYNGGTVTVGDNGAATFRVNTNALYVTSGNNVGIGTTSPSAKLDVWGNLNVGTSSTPTLFANTGTGNVGIGTSTPSNALEVVGNIRTSGYYGTTLNPNPRLNFGSGQAYLSGNPYIYLGSGSAVTAHTLLANPGYAVLPGVIVNASLDNQIALQVLGKSATQTSDLFQVANFDASSIYLDVNASGNVGIGTSTPATKLSVTGSSYFDGGVGIGTVNNATGTLKVSGNATIGSNLLINTILNCNSSSNTLQTDGSGQVVCATVTTIGGTSAGGWTYQSPNIVRLATTTDIVGMGVVNPSAKLDINSGSAATTTLALHAVTSQTANILEVYDNSLTLNTVITSAGRLGLGVTAPT
ncbi:MAG: hypothetical protein WCK60_03495, partial [Candidatus Nomurabacteria bacterium]